MVNLQKLVAKLAKKRDKQAFSYLLFLISDVLHRKQPSTLRPLTPNLGEGGGGKATVFLKKPVQQTSKSNYPLPYEGKEVVGNAPKGSGDCWLLNGTY